jgi:hypothetical protein
MPATTDLLSSWPLSDVMVLCAAIVVFAIAFGTIR